MKKIIILNGKKIQYELERKNVKNINLRVRFDCSVYVSANNSITGTVIHEFMQKKSDYILSAIEKYSKFMRYDNKSQNYVTGESFRYLGKDLRLIIKHGKNEVISDGIYLTLTTRNVENKIAKARLINKWYDTQCKKVFTEIISDTYRIFRKYNLEIPNLKIRNMTTRWGSCRPKNGVITLAKRLIEAPRNAIEYVVMHEFIHFLHPNHSQKFYEMLLSLMPDWKERKKLLEKTFYYI